MVKDKFFPLNENPLKGFMESIKYYVTLKMATPSPSLTEFILKIQISI